MTKLPMTMATYGKERGNETSIDYQVAKGYFGKNTVKHPLIDPQIVSQQQFDELFWMAVVMGQDGRPTPIEVGQQDAIAVVKPASDRAIRLTPIRLETDGEGYLTFTYHKQTGRKQRYTSSAALIILVNKQVTGRIRLTEKR